MARKKAGSKRGSGPAAKRNAPAKRIGAAKKGVRRSSKNSSQAKRSSAFKKAPRGSVILVAGGQMSREGKHALRVFSAGVQSALGRLARLGIPAVVIENGRTIEAVPMKRGGKYVVAEPRTDSAAYRPHGTAKRGQRDR